MVRLFGLYAFHKDSRFIRHLFSTYVIKSNRIFDQHILHIVNYDTNLTYQLRVIWYLSLFQIKSRIMSHIFFGAPTWCPRHSARCLIVRIVFFFKWLDTQKVWTLIQLHNWHYIRTFGYYFILNLCNSGQWNSVKFCWNSILTKCFW